MRPWRLFAQDRVDRPTFDPTTGVLRIKGVAPHRGRFIGIGAVPPAALAEMRKQLPENVANLSDAVIDLGLRGPKRADCPAGADALVACAEPGVTVSSWRLPDRVLLLVKSGPGTQAKNINVKLALEPLGLTPKLKWQEFINLREVSPTPQVTKATLDYYAGVLTVPDVRPNTTRLICVRRY